MKKIYDPQLLWAYLERWYESRPGFNRLTANRLTLFIYLKTRGGAFYLHGPKLYWDEDPSDGYFSNCDQNSLESEEGNLAEVVVFGLKNHRDPTLFVSYSEFLDQIGLKAPEAH